MSALIADVIEGNLTPIICNTAISASARMLKAAEMQIKYGTHQHPRRVLSLSDNGHGKPEPLALTGRKGSGS